MPPPTGTVTFLFTDIEGSTALWERDSEAMQAALEQHDALMREAIESAGGHVFKTVGDAFCAAFATAADALGAAIASQRALLDADWSVLGEAGALAARMGLHTGAASERDGDYFGRPVNRVARLESAGHGGQVLLSQATQLLVRDELPEGFALRDWGEHRLKDLQHSEHIYQLQGPGLPKVETPPSTADALHPRDRVRVAEAGQETGQDQDSPWSRLETAVLSEEGGSVTLTPAEARTLARHKPADWREYRLGRIAEWSQPRYRLDGRFVGLTLLIDQGEASTAGRWAAGDDRFADLGELLDATDEPALVVLGPPGGGKSTLLRRLELDTAIDGLRDPSEAGLTFFIPMNHYRPETPGAAPPAPGPWLAERWNSRFPDLPPLDELLAAGRMTLLLDALNEMPAGSEAEFRSRVQLWKSWLQTLVTEQPGNRVLISCRSLDYSQPLSTPELRVPQVRIEPLADSEVRDFLELYSPGHWRTMWEALEGSPQLEVLRSPYFLALLVEQVEASGEMPKGRASLFTGFVRQALRREIERGNPLFEPGELLASRDVKRVAGWKWKGAYDLPERGTLMPKLATLAHAMQTARAEGEQAQVRVDLDDALHILDTEADEAIVAAGNALAVLDEDQAAEELMYIHQLVQEYFAARELAKRLDPELLRAEWRAAELQPSLAELIEELDPADPLPGLPQTGWEETALLAAAMSKEPAAFVEQLMPVNLALAGRCAAQAELLPRLPEALRDRLREALAARAGEPAADLRDRIACVKPLGALGDPRFERRDGPDGPYLMPPLAEIAGGVYPIGDDERIAWTHPTAGDGSSATHMPQHGLELAAFRIGRFPVTNAEWACFMAAGGYEDERWWDTEDGRRWRRGELPNAGAIVSTRVWRQRILDDPAIFDRMVEDASFSSKESELQLQRWVKMDDETFEAEIAEKFKGKRITEPLFWDHPLFNQPSQPVVGICWYEARAFCSWLSAQTGLAVRLPTEVEWEAAARGKEGRRYAYGEPFDRLKGNVPETQLKQPSPVGVFTEGQSPEGVFDLIGNVFEWTTSLYGSAEHDEDSDEDQTDFPYPYDPKDGREDLEADPEIRRVVRGGAYASNPSDARAVFRYDDFPADGNTDGGMRIVVALP